MQLAGEFEFLELSQQDGVDVWKACEKSSGKPVLIHLYPTAKQDTANAICERLLALSSEDRKKVLKFGPVRDATCFVTDLLPEGESLQSWIDKKGVSQAPEAGSASRVRVIGNLRKPGIEPGPVAPVPRGPDMAPEQARTDALPASDGRQPGAFTQMYSAQELQQNPSPPHQAPTMPASPAENRSSPDSWSKLYAVNETRTFVPPVPDRFAPEPEPVPPKPSNSLESFIFPKSDIPAPSAPAPSNVVSKPLEKPRPAPPEPPPMIVRRHDTPAPPKPLPLFDLPPVPGPEPPPVLSPLEPVTANMPNSEPRVKPIADSLPSAPYRPVAPSPMPHRPPVSFAAVEKPRSESAVDWRIVLLVVAILLIAGGALVAIIESAAR
jgi:hypothetical protein